MTLALDPWLIPPAIIAVWSWWRMRWRAGAVRRMEHRRRKYCVTVRGRRHPLARLVSRPFVIDASYGGADDSWGDTGRWAFPLTWGAMSANSAVRRDRRDRAAAGRANEFEQEAESARKELMRQLKELEAD